MAVKKHVWISIGLFAFLRYRTAHYFGSFIRAHIDIFVPFTLPNLKAILDAFSLTLLTGCHYQSLICERPPSVY